MLEIVLFAVACVRYAFPFVFEAKEERGAVLPVLAARKWNESHPSPHFYFRHFHAVFDSRSLFFAPKPTETLATQAKGESRNHLWKFIVLIAH